MVKLRVIEMRALDHPGGPNDVITKVLIREGGQVVVVMEEEVEVEKEGGGGGGGRRVKVRSCDPGRKRIVNQRAQVASRK